MDFGAAITNLLLYVVIRVVSHNDKHKNYIH